MGDVYLAVAEAPKPAAISTPQPVPAGPVRLSMAAEAYAFIARYKDTFFAELARARVDEVKKEQMAVVVPPIVPVPAILACNEGAPHVPPNRFRLSACASCNAVAFNDAERAVGGAGS